jgi:hypothetical protein
LNAPTGEGSPPLRLACFVTPHGFGHAARACAVLAALGRRRPIEVELFTAVPEWFFRDSLELPFRYHFLRTDVGLVQPDAMREDLPATVAALRELVPFRLPLLDELAGELRARACTAVLCDIAPLGIAAASRAGLPSALLENFTWDWIYAAYTEEEPRLAPFAAELARWFSAADLHLQATPACRPAPGAVAVAPIARRAHRPAAEVRADLGLAPGERAVLLTMGGIAWDFADLATRLPAGVVWIVPGGSPDGERRLPGAVLMPFRSRFHHPDLVAASDAVVGKLGYSTFAEAWSAGVPYGFIPRERFPESAVLGELAASRGAGCAVPAAALSGRVWEWLDELLAIPRRPPVDPRGDDEAAGILDSWLGGLPRPGPGTGPISPGSGR